MGHWTPHFTRHFNDWELDIVGTFLSRLRGNLVRRDDNDKVIWKDDKKGLFFFFFDNRGCPGQFTRTSTNLMGP